MDMLARPLPALNDKEGTLLPDGMPWLVDAHVHIFPDPLFAAVRKWFDLYGWPIRYRQSAVRTIEFLLQRGVAHVIALQYAHRAGLARELNRFAADLQVQFEGRVSGLATVFPGEDNAAEILQEGFAAGLKGVKLHQHVQCFALDSTAMQTVYRTCTDSQMPLLMHAGREPKSPAYPCDPHEFCRIDLVEAVVRAYPDLKLCIPHLGADEFEPYRKLLERVDNLWLDTTMALTDYLPGPPRAPLSRYRPERILFGSDFPNLPYAWDREHKQVLREGLDAESLARVCGTNAARFYGISLPKATS